jgi:hypothetical protein
MEKIRIIAVIVLLLVIVVTGVATYLNKDTLFRNEVVITYPDRCVEVFVNRELTTPECTEGRKMLEEQENKYSDKGVSLLDYGTNFSSS